MYLLKMAAYGNRKVWPQQIVRLSQDRVEESALLAKVSRVALATQILNDLAGVKWKPYSRRFHLHMCEGIVEFIIGICNGISV